MVEKHRTRPKVVDGKPQFRAVVDENGCWIWQHSKTGRGYGRVRVAGQIVYAHRWVYERQVGPIPEGYLVCHHCDNPSCINPEHLFVGTHKDNTRDAWAKGRGRVPQMM